MSILSNFAERLLELMQERELNSPALAKELGTDRSNITRYIRAEQAPYFSLFVQILDYFAVSADYMLGLTDYSDEKSFLPVPLFGDRLRYVMQYSKATQYGIEKALHVSGSVMYRWLNNQSLPTIESLARLAKYMDVSVDFLLGRRN